MCPAHDKIPLLILQKLRPIGPISSPVQNLDLSCSVVRGNNCRLPVLPDGTPELQSAIDFFLRRRPCWRSEERRVGKACRVRCWPSNEKTNLSPYARHSFRSHCGR